MNKYTNYIISTVFFLIIALSSHAQNHKQCRHHREVIKAERVSFITESLSLSVKEAQEFWPIYNDYNKEIEELRDTKYSEMAAVRKNTKTYSDKDYQIFLNKRMSHIEKEVQLKKKYQNDLYKVFSAKKIYLLYQAEKEFKRKLIKDFRGKKPNCIN